VYLYLSQIGHGDLYSSMQCLCPLEVPSWSLKWSFGAPRGAFKIRVYSYLSQISYGDLYSFIWCLYPLEVPSKSFRWVFGAPRSAFNILVDLYLSQIRYGDLYSFCVVFIPPWGFPSNRSGAFKRRVYLYLSQIDCGDLYSFIWCLYPLEVPSKSFRWVFGAPRSAFNILVDLYLSQIRYGDLYSFCVVFIPPWGFPSNRSGAFKRRVYLYLSQIDCGDLYSFIWCLYRRDKNQRRRDKKYIFLNYKNENIKIINSKYIKNKYGISFIGERKMMKKHWFSLYNKNDH
jgi:hypothetical protein